MKNSRIKNTVKSSLSETVQEQEVLCGVLPEGLGFRCCDGDGAKAALTACSNALSEKSREQVEKLDEFLTESGFETVFSRCLYGVNGSAFSGTPRERAEALMRFYRDPEVRMIFDVSGGDAANGILPYLDFEEIRKSGAVFWGYSDLTTVINAIYAKTGKLSVLYQARNFAEESGEWQKQAFQKLVQKGGLELFRFSCEWIRGTEMEGVVVGGNLRCLLKLAGTEYWPDMNGKILLLEARGGLAPQMGACLAQLAQMGVFEQINGILLGTFLSMEEKRETPGIEELIAEYAGTELPLAKTSQIGHRTDSHGILIGGRLALRRNQEEY